MPDYGRDVQTLWSSAGSDLDPYFRPVTGTKAIAHAVARRLVTPTGSLFWEPTAGFDLRGMLGSAGDAGVEFAIASAVEAQALADKRVAAATATIAFSRETSSARVALELVAMNGETFSLVLGVSSVTVELLAVRG